MSPFLASHRFLLGGLIGPLPYSFLFGLFQGPFLFLKEGHPTVAVTHNCLYPTVGQWALSLVPHGYFFLFGPLFGPCLLAFWAFGAHPNCLSFSLLSLFFELVWAFSAIGPFLPLGLWVHISKNRYQQCAIIVDRKSVV